MLCNRKVLFDTALTKRKVIKKWKLLFPHNFVLFSYHPQELSQKQIRVNFKPEFSANLFTNFRGVQKDWRYQFENSDFFIKVKNNVVIKVLS